MSEPSKPLVLHCVGVISMFCSLTRQTDLKRNKDVKDDDVKSYIIVFTLCLTTALHISRSWKHLIFMSSPFPYVPNPSWKLKKLIQSYKPIVFIDLKGDLSLCFLLTKEVRDQSHYMDPKSCTLLQSGSNRKAWMLVAHLKDNVSSLPQCCSNHSTGNWDCQGLMILLNEQGHCCRVDRPSFKICTGT